MAKVAERRPRALRRWPSLAPTSSSIRSSPCRQRSFSLEPAAQGSPVLRLLLARFGVGAAATRLRIGGANGFRLRLLHASLLHLLGGFSQHLGKLERDRRQALANKLGSIARAPTAGRWHPARSAAGLLLARRTRAGVAQTLGGRSRSVRRARARRARGRHTGRRRAGARRTGARRTGARRTGARRTGARRTGARRTGARRTGARRTGARRTGARRTGARPTGPCGRRPWGTRARRSRACAALPCRSTRRRATCRRARCAGVTSRTTRHRPGRCRRRRRSGSGTPRASLTVARLGVLAFRFRARRLRFGARKPLRLFRAVGIWLLARLAQPWLRGLLGIHGAGLLHVLDGAGFGRRNAQDLVGQLGRALLAFLDHAAERRGPLAGGVSYLRIRRHRAAHLSLVPLGVAARTFEAASAAEASRRLRTGLPSSAARHLPPTGWAPALERQCSRRQRRCEAQDARPPARSRTKPRWPAARPPMTAPRRTARSSGRAVQHPSLGSPGSP